jgi:hypothetical protein
MHTVFVKLLSGDILPLSVEETSMELVRQQLAEHLGCHMTQVTLFPLEEGEEKAEAEAEEAETEEQKEEAEEGEEKEDIPFVDGSCYGVAVHPILPLHLSLQSQGIHYSEQTYHGLHKFKLSLFTPIPYRLLHEIYFYCKEYHDETGQTFYPDKCVRHHPRRTYIALKEEGEDTLYGLLEKEPFLQADYVDREQVAQQAERLFQKYMAELDAFEDELLTDEEREGQEEQ